MDLSIHCATIFIIHWALPSSLWNALSSSLHLCCCLDLVPLYPFSKANSTLGVFALRALPSGLYCERHFIILEIRYAIRNSTMARYAQTRRVPLNMYSPCIFMAEMMLYSLRPSLCNSAIHSNDRMCILKLWKGGKMK